MTSPYLSVEPQTFRVERSSHPAMSSLVLDSEPPSTIAPASAQPITGGRLMSLDALRGFDMFWILGGDAMMFALGAMSKAGPLWFFVGQFHHKDWAGFAFYDLIFPLFIFMSGVSIVFSLTRLQEQHGRAGAVKRVLRRGGLLFLLGLIYSGGVTTAWPDIRLLGVLQRIALAYLGAGLLFCFFKPRALAGITTALLLGYWALLTFVPIRDVQLERNALPKQMGVAKPTLAQAHDFYERTTTWVTGGYEPGRNLTNHLDFEYLPGRKYDLYWDPEGLLSTFPAIATCLLGAFAGLCLRRTDWTDQQKIARLVIGGAAALAIGWLWHLQFPVVKKIWTSSFVLVAAGYSLLLLAAFYWVIDVRRWRGWCRPFVWIGMNAVTLYVVSNLLQGYRRIAQRFVGGDVKAFFDSTFTTGMGDLVIAVVGTALMLTLAWFLHRKQIFLRL
jgi:predicted acyltransferase